MSSKIGGGDNDAGCKSSAASEGGKTSSSSACTGDVTVDLSGAIGRGDAALRAVSASSAGSVALLQAAQKKGMAMTDEQQLLHRAVGHVYSKIIQPAEEGGFADWFNLHCVKFNTAKHSEHSLEYTALHREYEHMVEKALVEFTSQEGISDHQDLYMRILRAKDDKRFESTVNLLLAAADYKKFVSLMKRKHRMLQKQRAAAAARAPPKRGPGRGPMAAALTLASSATLSGGAGKEQGAADVSPSRRK